MRNYSESKSRRYIIPILIFFIALTIEKAVSYPGEYLDKEYSSPGAHQLASWLASQRRPKENVVPVEVPVLSYYRLPVQGKRNSEMTNAIIGSEETQKMYRDGRKK